MEVALPLRRTLSVPCPIIPPLFPPVSLKENPKTDEIILYQPGNPSSSEHKALPNCTLSTPTNNVIEVPNTPSQTELQTEEPSQRSIASSRVRFSSPVVDRVYTYGEDDPNSFEIEEVPDSIDVQLPPIILESQPDEEEGCTAKQLQPPPVHAERDIQIMGKFSFCKGVRIRDYVPVHSVPVKTMLRKAPQFQCRDRFEDHEVWMGKPRLFSRSLRQQDEIKSEVPPPKATKYKKRRIIYDPVRDSKRINLPSFGELELLPPSLEPGGGPCAQPASITAPEC